MWTHLQKEVTKDNFPKEYTGFIYMMCAVIDGKVKYYIGKKTVYSLRKKALGKRELSLITDKRLKKHKHVQTFTPFDKYYSSNIILQEAHANGIHIQRVILHLCKTKSELTYEETKYLFKFDVLINDEFLNDNILGKFYKSRLFIDDEHED